MKLNRIINLLLLSCLCILILTGCNSSLVVEEFIVDADFYNSNGYFIGHSQVDMSIKLSEALDNDVSYKWSSTGGEILSQDKNNITYQTPQVPGDYEISVLISNERGESINYKFPFAVRGSYPDKVTLKELKNESIEAGILLDWSDYLGADFYAYKIFRSNNTYIDESTKVVAEFDQYKNSFYIDHDIEENQVYTYQVMVINNRGYFSLSNEAMIQTWSEGIKELEVGDDLAEILTDPLRNRVYISNRSKRQLLILGNKAEDIIKRIELNIIPQNMTLSPDSRFLFCISSEAKHLISINLLNWQINEYEFNSKITAMAVNGEYAYLNIKGEYNLLKFNIQTGEIEEKFKLKRKEELIYGEEIRIIDDSYLLVDENFGDTLLYFLDQFSNPVNNLDITSIKDISVDSLEDNNLFYIISDYPDYVKMVQLDSEFNIKSKDSIVTDSYPKGLALDRENNLLFVVSDNKSIYTFSTKDYSLIDKVKLKSYIYDIAINTYKKKIYLLTSSNHLTKNDIVIINYE